LSDCKFFSELFQTIKFKEFTFLGGKGPMLLQVKVWN